MSANSLTLTNRSYRLFGIMIRWKEKRNSFAVINVKLQLKNFESEQLYSKNFFLEGLKKWFNFVSIFLGCALGCVSAKMVIWFVDSVLIYFGKYSHCKLYGYLCQKLNIQFRNASQTMHQLIPWYTVALIFVFGSMWMRMPDEILNLKLLNRITCRFE